MALLGKEGGATSGSGASGSGGNGGSSLPKEIVESIAIANAKSIGEQPAILANMALANQILNNNLQQQISISQQQAMNQLSMAALSKCIAVITSTDGGGESAEAFKDAQKLIKILTGSKLSKKKKDKKENKGKNSDFDAKADNSVDE